MSENIEYLSVPSQARRVGVGVRQLTDVSL